MPPRILDSRILLLIDARQLLIIDLFYNYPSWRGWQDLTSDTLFSRLVMSTAVGMGK